MKFHGQLYLSVTRIVTSCNAYTELMGLFIVEQEYELIGAELATPESTLRRRIASLSVCMVCRIPYNLPLSLAWHLISFNLLRIAWSG